MIYLPENHKLFSYNKTFTPREKTVPFYPSYVTDKHHLAVNNYCNYIKYYTFAGLWDHETVIKMGLEP